MFRDTSFSTTSQIGQVFSSDYGNTWTGHSAFEFNASQNTYFEYLSTQGTPNETVLETVNNKEYYWQSANNGLTWQGPYLLTNITPASGGTFSLGCRGVIFAFIGPNTSVYARRYDWYPICTGHPQNAMWSF